MDTVSVAVTAVSSCGAAAAEAFRYSCGVLLVSLSQTSSATGANKSSRFLPI